MSRSAPRRLRDDPEERQDAQVSASGERRWEPKARGSQFAIRASADGRFVVSQWVLSAATGEPVA